MNRLLSISLAVVAMGAMLTAETAEAQILRGLFGGRASCAPTRNLCRPVCGPNFISRTACAPVRTNCVRPGFSICPPVNCCPSYNICQPRPMWRPMNFCNNYCRPMVCCPPPVCCPMVCPPVISCPPVMPAPLPAPVVVSPPPVITAPPVYHDPCPPVSCFRPCCPTGPPVCGYNNGCGNGYDNCNNSYCGNNCGNGCGWTQQGCTPWLPDRCGSRCGLFSRTNRCGRGGLLRRLFGL